MMLLFSFRLWTSFEQANSSSPAECTSFSVQERWTVKLWPRRFLAASTLSASRVSGLRELSAQCWCLLADRLRSKVRGQKLEGRTWPYRQQHRERVIPSKELVILLAGGDVARAYIQFVLERLWVSHIYMLTLALICIHAHLASRCSAGGQRNAVCEMCHPWASLRGPCQFVSTFS